MDYILSAPLTSNDPMRTENFYSEYAVTEIHNHPNGTPPSPQDLLFTAEWGKDTPGYKSTLAYDHKTGNYYGLYINSRNNLARLYRFIKDEIDSSTNDFKDGGIINNILARGNRQLKKIIG